MKMATKKPGRTWEQMMGFLFPDIASVERVYHWAKRRIKRWARTGET